MVIIDELILAWVVITRGYLGWTLRYSQNL